MPLDFPYFPYGKPTFGIDLRPDQPGFTPEQRQFFESCAERKVLLGDRGSGKTYALVNLAIHRALNTPGAPVRFLTTEEEQPISEIDALITECYLRHWVGDSLSVTATPAYQRLSLNQDGKCIGSIDVSKLNDACPYPNTSTTIVDGALNLPDDMIDRVLMSNRYPAKPWMIVFGGSVSSDSARTLHRLFNLGCESHYLPSLAQK